MPLVDSSSSRAFCPQLITQSLGRSLFTRQVKKKKKKKKVVVSSSYIDVMIQRLKNGCSRQIRFLDAEDNGMVLFGAAN